MSKFYSKILCEQKEFWKGAPLTCGRQLDDHVPPYPTLSHSGQKSRGRKFPVRILIAGVTHQPHPTTSDRGQKNNGDGLPMSIASLVDIPSFLWAGPLAASHPEGAAPAPVLATSAPHQRLLQARCGHTATPRAALTGGCAPVWPAAWVGPKGSRNSCEPAPKGLRTFYNWHTKYLLWGTLGR